MSESQLETAAELAGVALRHALLSQISVISRLMVRLVASGAISREDAEHVLVETAKDLSLAGSEEPASGLHRILLAPLAEHAKALSDAGHTLP
jgi:hypothetical protein